MTNQYVGVSGFMSRAEVQAALAVFPDCGRDIMVGVLASSKSLCNQPLKQPLRYPKCEDIANIFVDDPRCLNLVHVYNDHEWKSDVDGTTIPLIIDMFRAMDAGGPLCHGLQVNAARPTSIDLQWFRDKHPSARVVLQVRPAMIRVLEGHSRSRLNALGCLANVTDVLIDASLGKGKTLNLDATRLSIDTIRHWSPDMRIGVAGGLCAATVSAIGALIREGVSVDAEGRLRDDTDGGGRLDMFEVQAYLSAVAAEVAQ